MIRDWADWLFVIFITAAFVLAIAGMLGVYALDARQRRTHRILNNLPKGHASVRRDFEEEA